MTLGAIWLIFLSVCLFVCFYTGAKPVFPGKDDKDKPKFALKQSKESSKYPL